MDKRDELELLQSLKSCEYGLSKQELSHIRRMTGHEGWKPFLKLLMLRFAQEYDKLRYKGGKQKTDFSHGRINGILDGLEIAMHIADEKTERKSSPDLGSDNNENNNP